VTTPVEAESAWARAEKKMLGVPNRYNGRGVSVRRAHEYSAPLVPPIFSAATSDTAMRAPTTSSPLIEPARRRASTARSTVGTGIYRWYFVGLHTVRTRLQRQATITVTGNGVHSGDLRLGLVQLVACPLHRMDKRLYVLRTHFRCLIRGPLGSDSGRCWR
jgi:hypothetical protein